MFIPKSWGKLSRLALTTALVSGVGLTSAAQAQIEEIVVTSQKKEQSIQSIPISVTAFDAAALEARQIESFSDLQFNTPNVTFTKTNFTGTNFQIRGIGSNAVAASGDGGVGIHINDAPMRSAQLFETEYFDIERMEIARGPQGTLFGRNATGGVVNMITKKPDLGEFAGRLTAQVGNFDHLKAEAMLNIPIGDALAVRLAGLQLERDGFTENLYTDNSIDGRDQYALRGSIRWDVTDNTRFDFMYSYMEEDSNRSRMTKQMCHYDPSAILGCLPDKLAYETSNGWATLGGILVSDVVLGPLAWGSVFGPDLVSGSPNPSDLREVYTDFEPLYAADENLWIAQIEHQFAEHTLTLLGSGKKASVWSRTDYNWAVNDPVTLPGVFAAALPTNAAYYLAAGGGDILTSKISDSDVGVSGGNYTVSALPDGWDQSSGQSEQWTAEIRLASNFDSDFNYLVGGFMMHTESDGSYYVVASALDWFSVTGGGDGIGLLSPYYRNHTAVNELDSWAIFGEVYFDVMEDVKLTAGLRFNNDEKYVKDRQTLLTSGFTLIGVDPGTPLTAPPFRPDAEAKASWEEMTGRALIEWTPNLSWTDDTLFYGSYSRGYKGGGMNPPTFTATTAQTFDPEFINAIEIGMKNTMLGNTLTANFTGFWYDYEGLQISKIVDRSSLNENIDAEIWGLEAEMLWAPNETWLANMTISLLNTEIANGEESIDPRDPTDGLPGYLLIKDLSNASNCVFDPGAMDIATASALIGFALPLGTTPIPGLASDGAMSTCAGLEGAIALLDGAPPVGWIAGEASVTGGNPTDLSGNALQNSPEWTFNIGAQRTHYFNNGMSFVARLDYYKQGDMYARIHNRPVDKIPSWQMVNLSATLVSEDQSWELKGYIQNLLDDDNVTGHYFTDASSGNFTNVFVLDPRTFGLTINVKF